jgi:hypothetical protein
MRFHAPTAHIRPGSPQLLRSTQPRSGAARRRERQYRRLTPPEPQRPFRAAAPMGFTLQGLAPGRSSAALPPNRALVSLAAGVFTSAAPPSGPCSSPGVRTSSTDGLGPPRPAALLGFTSPGCSASRKRDRFHGPSPHALPTGDSTASHSVRPGRRSGRHRVLTTGSPTRSLDRADPPEVSPPPPPRLLPTADAGWAAFQGHLLVTPRVFYNGARAQQQRERAAMRRFALCGAEIRGVLHWQRSPLAPL